MAAIAEQHERIRAELSLDLVVVAIASRRDGFLYREQGIELDKLGGSQRWQTALAGLSAIEMDILLEVSQSPVADGEPGLSHIRQALRQGASVATSNKWPVALAGVELKGLADEQGLGFRAESTVMSGTPLLAALTGGIAGTTPLRLRGVLNATVNFICSRLAEEVGYEQALAEAQAAGLAEPDPGADVDGLDSLAKLMVLSALVFGEQLAVDDVSVRGISAVPRDEIESALADGLRLREVSTLDPASGRRSVDVVAVPASDPLFDVQGTQNLVTVRVDPIGEISIAGPGAGPALAGQGVFSDLLALARERALSRS